MRVCNFVDLVSILIVVTEDRSDTASPFLDNTPAVFPCYADYDMAVLASRTSCTFSFGSPDSMRFG